MAIVEFVYQPSGYGKLLVSALTTQADVDAVFTSVITSGWAVRPTWDVQAQQVTWQQLQSPFGYLVQVPVGGVVCVERPRFHGTTQPASANADVVAYQPGEWSDSTVTYL